ncbi:MAG: hypothetical protein K6T83_22940, partial [Alicyclobacillus sp.]|nr:hypothetical protein [Alicyclobacillus sp.]
PIPSQAEPATAAPVVSEVPASAAEDSAQSASSAPVRRRGGTAKWMEELAAVTEALRNAGRPVKADELRSMVPEVHWGNQPTLKMTALVNKSKGQIVRVGRGIYQLAAAE